MINFICWAFVGLFVLFTSIMLINTIIGAYKEYEEKRLMEDMIEFQKRWREKRDKERQ